MNMIITTSHPDLALMQLEQREQALDRHDSLIDHIEEGLCRGDVFPATSYGSATLIDSTVVSEFFDATLVIQAILAGKGDQAIATAAKAAFCQACRETAVAYADDIARAITEY